MLATVHAFMVKIKENDVSKESELKGNGVSVYVLFFVFNLL
jgi:hypothetical protein